MKTADRMKMISVETYDLSEAVSEYEKAKKDFGIWASLHTHRHCSKEAIKRRITQIRQNLLVLEKEL